MPKINLSGDIIMSKQTEEELLAIKKKAEKAKAAEVKAAKAKAGKDEVVIETLKRIGLEDRTSEVGEIVILKIEDAEKLQDAKAVKIKL